MEITLNIICTITVTLVLYTVTGSKYVSQAISNDYWDDIKPKVINGSAGKNVHIVCPYPEGHDDDDDAFLCKGQNPVSCERMTQKNNHQVSRVNKRLNRFSVYISNLSKNDSGIYWCRSNETWKQKEYIKVQLYVAEDTKKSKKSRLPTLNVTAAPARTPKSSMASSTSTTTQPKHSIFKDIIVPVLVCPILLAVAVLTLVFLRHKITWKQGGSSMQGTPGGSNNLSIHADHHYEEIHTQSLSGNPMLNPPADHVHYSSVSFQQESKSVSTEQNKPNTDNIDSSSEYSSIVQVNIHPEANIIYSTVTRPTDP
uniref:uncharacterized protein LOC131136786 isoform X2 n=1 Tax=Doryrhamphus excisus TaxID=161450 RepID=UPI0025AE23CA|nr:uncharacterized protein LOC131136786 isoform X2 [Doryrhamphus excisus]